MAAVRAARRWRTLAKTPSSVLPPWRSKSSWPFRVSFTDSMSWRSGFRNGLLARPFSSALLIGASRTDERGPMIGEEGLELGRGVALVPHDLLAGTAGKQVRIDLEHIPGHLTLIGFGVGQGESDRQARGGADEVPAQPPEPPGVGGAVARGGAPRTDLLAVRW